MKRAPNGTYCQRTTISAVGCRCLFHRRKEGCHVKLTLEIKLGNDAMATAAQAIEAFRRSIPLARLGTEPLEKGDEGQIRDANGNTVGTWRVA